MFVEYPKWLYHPVLEPKLVDGPKAEADLLASAPGWGPKPGGDPDALLPADDEGDAPAADPGKKPPVAKKKNGTTKADNPQPN